MKKKTKRMTSYFEKIPNKSRTTRKRSIEKPQNIHIKYNYQDLENHNATWKEVKTKARN